MNQLYFGSEWDEKVIEATKTTLTSVDTAKKLNVGFKTYKRHAIRLGIFRIRKGGPPIDLAAVLNGTNKTAHQSVVKRALLREGLKKNICEVCGISAWRDKPIVCQLHHINGDSTDNRLENLKMICPNCHSQTDTFTGKNRYRYS